MFDAGKTIMIGLPYGKNYDDMLSCFHMVPECNGQTDGQTGLLYQYRASVCWHAIKTKRVFFCGEKIFRGGSSIYEMSQVRSDARRSRSRKRRRGRVGLLRDLGERRKLPRRGLGRSPGRKRVLLHFGLERNNAATKISNSDTSLTHKNCVNLKSHALKVWF